MTNNNDIVRLSRNNLHFLPVTPSRKRELNFQKTYKIDRGNVFQYSITARETLNVYDLMVLLSVLMVCQKKIAQIEDGGEIKNSAGIKILKLTIPQRKLCKIAGLSGCFRDRKNVWESLERIQNARWRWYINKNGNLITPSTAIIYEVERDEILKNGKFETRNFKVFLDKKYIELTMQNKHTLFVRIHYMRICNTDIGKLLVYWLQGQKNNIFSEETLLKALLLISDDNGNGYKNFEARRKLKTALNAAQNCGYLKKWSSEKTDHSYKYKIQR